MSDFKFSKHAAITKPTKRRKIKTKSCCQAKLHLSKRESLAPINWSFCTLLCRILYYATLQPNTATNRRTSTTTLTYSGVQGVDRHKQRYCKAPPPGGQMRG